MSIRTRIILAFALIVTASFYFLLRHLTDEVEKQYLQALEEPMVDMAHLLAALLETDLQDGAIDAEAFRQALPRVAEREFEARIYGLRKTAVTMHVYVTDEQGRVVFDSAAPGRAGGDYSTLNDVFLTLRGGYGARSTRLDEEDERSSVMYVGAPIFHEGDIVGVVSVGKPQHSMALFMQETRQTIVTVGLLTAGCAILAAIAFSALLTRPIARLTRYARDVKRGERAPLPRLGRSEIGRLGSAFEEMRDELEGRNYVENYVQTMTHEMKSPVAAIRGAAELLEEPMPEERRRTFLANIQGETQRLQDIIDRLLHLSALEGRRRLEPVESVQLDELAREVCRALEPAAMRHNVQLEHGKMEPVKVAGERLLLRTAVGNLVSNAIDFSPEGGVVRVQVEQTAAGASVVVEDAGSGIADYAMDRVFDRFYSMPRPGSGRKSSGLGLCFVREIADLHGGGISLANREEGGLRATLKLPHEKG